MDKQDFGVPDQLDPDLTVCQRDSGLCYQGSHILFLTLSVI